MSDLQQRRESLDLTQAEMAKIMQTDRQNVSKIERGVRPAPYRYDRLLTLLELLPKRLRDAQVAAWLL